MERRRECYENAADFTVNTDGRTIADVAEEVRGLLMSGKKVP